VLRTCDLIAFAATTDLERARAFYEGVIGLEVREQSPYACVFDAAGTMLRVTAVGAVTQPGYTVLGWRVPDIVEAMIALAARGVRFLRYDGMEQDEHGAWTTAGGDRIAWFRDPDGNVLSLTQFAPD